MKFKGFRWWIIGLICLGTIINYLARNSLAVSAPQLQVKLNFTTAEYHTSWVRSIGYCVMQSICGYFLDVSGLRLGFSLFGVAWSVFNMWHAAAGGWLALPFPWDDGLERGGSDPGWDQAISESFQQRNAPSPSATLMQAHRSERC